MLQSDRVATLDISTNDFVSPSCFPHDLDASHTRPLSQTLISSNRVADLTAQIKLKIIQNIVPGLRKDGYSEEATDSSATTPESNHQQSRDPAPARPRFQQPENLYQPPSLFPPRNPLEIGRRDLDPIPMNPFTPPSIFPHSGDGMFVGPDHPIFGAGRSREPFGDRGPWGGDGFLPPMGAPPGARFDPIGPQPLPGPGRLGSFATGRRDPPTRGPNSGEPDNDEFMPPGAVR